MFPLAYWCESSPCCKFQYLPLLSDAPAALIVTVRTGLTWAVQRRFGLQWSELIHISVCLWFNNETNCLPQETGSTLSPTCRRRKQNIWPPDAHQHHRCHHCYSAAAGLQHDLWPPFQDRHSDESLHSQHHVSPTLCCQRTLRRWVNRCSKSTHTIVLLPRVLLLL